LALNNRQRDILAINDIIQDSYHTSIEIICADIVENGTSVLFTSGETISLNESFEVVLGAAFEAYIGTCID